MPTDPYVSWTTAATTIQDAVNAASSGDTILVTNGHYRLTSPISLGKALTIQSVNGPDVTIVDGQTFDRCFDLGNYASVLSGLTITNGYAVGNGGGVYCSDRTPVLTNCVVAGNSATGLGGGMFRGTAYDCTISGNTVSGDGGYVRRFFVQLQD